MPRLALISIAFLIFTCGTWGVANAQCANDNVFWTSLNPTGPGNTQTTSSIWGGEYVTVNVCAGAAYTFQTCGSSFDTQITVYNSTGGASLAYNDNSCGLQSTVTWTSTFNGTVNVLVDAWPCASNTTFATLSVTQLTACTTTGGTNYNHPGGTITTCAGNYFDTGGQAGNYGNSQNIVTTFCSATAGECVVLSFTSFSIENNWDFLTLYDGPNASSPLIGQYTGTNSPGTVTATSGCLTVRFTSDGSVNLAGWSATVSCVPCSTPPPPNDPAEFGCPAIDLGPDIALPECYDPCQSLELTADVFETGLPTSYEVQSIPFNPPYSTTAGTQFSINTDDVWSNLISLPFNFCYFGTNYNQCVVGSNGLMSFNAGYDGGYCPWAFTETCPSPLLPLNSIFGVYHDIDPSVCGTARYAILGAEPCRVFVVNFTDVCHFSCNSIRSTSQIVLYETTNVIEVYVQDKPTCFGWNSGNAVIGIQNATGAAGYVAPGRQTGPWSTSNEAWRFVPNGAPNFEVNWYTQADGLIGSGMTIQVCPSETSQTFAAEAVYTRCDGSQIVVEDFVTVTCALILLPVEWLVFDAKLTDDQRRVNCDWVTASETNNDFFTLERSSDTHYWEAIGTVQGAGTTLESRSYQFVDRNPLSGVSYYRVRQTDYNGESDVSEIRAVHRTNTAEGFAVYPNPGKGQFVLTGYREGDFSVYNAAGQRVPFSLTMAGELTLHTAAAGVYILELIRGDAMAPERIRLIVQ